MAAADDRLVPLLARSGAFAADDPVQERTRRAGLFRMAQGAGTVWWEPGMDVAGVLLELQGRVTRLAREAVDGLDPEQLAERPVPDAETVGELIRHLTRVQATLTGGDAQPPDDGGSVLEHLDAVHDRACDYLAGLRPCDLDTVVDDGPDRPAPLGVRLVGVIDDCLRLAGAAVQVRGLLARPQAPRASRRTASRSGTTEQ